MTNEVVLGPQHGELSLHTGREGLVSKAGHDLTIHVQDWSGVVTYKASEEIDQVRLVAQVSSLVVIHGDGGVKPLSDKDKATILKDALKTLDAQRHPEIVYEAGTVTPDGNGYTLTGAVTIAGVEKPLTVAVGVTAATDTTHITSTTEVTQSDFGIKPFSGMLGALRVRDLVEVRVDLTVPNP